MLYPSKELIQRRSAYQTAILAGDACAAEDLVLNWLSADPGHPGLLFAAAVYRIDAGDLEKAREYITRGIGVAPHLPLFYLLRHELLPAGHSEQQSMELAIRKANVYWNEWVDFLRSQRGSRHNVDCKLTDPLYIMKTALEFRDAHECTHFEGDFGAEFLIQQIIEQSSEAPVVGLVIQLAVDKKDKLLPMFEGLLLGFADPYFEAPCANTAVFSAVMIGELGNAKHLPWLLELIAAEDQDIAFASEWAFAQIAKNFPDKAITALRNVAATSSPAVFPDLVSQLWHLRDSKRAVELLDILLDSVPDVPPDDRDDMFLAIADAMLRADKSLAEIRLRAAYREMRRKLGKRLGNVLEGLFEDDDRPEFGLLPTAMVETPLIPFLQDLMADWADLADEDDELGDDFDEDEDEDEDEFDEDEEFGEDDTSTPLTATAPPPYDPEGKVAQAGNKVQEIFSKDIDAASLKDAVSKFAGGKDPKKLNPEALDMTAFMDWLLKDYRSRLFPDGIIAKYISKYPEKFNDFEKAMLSDWVRTSYSSLFEVQSIVPGSGLNLKDVFTGENVFVHELATATQVSVFSCFIARVINFGDKKLLSGSVLIVNRPMLPEIQKWARKKKGKQTWPAFLKQHGADLRMHVFQHHDQFMKNMSIVNFEGDPMEFSEGIYKVLDREAVISALEAHPAFSSNDSDDGLVSFAWLDAPAEGSTSRRSFGTLELSGSELKISCNSRERLKRGRNLVEHILPGKLARVAENISSLDEMRKKFPKGNPNPKDAEIPPEIAREIIENHYKSHYAKWIDTSLPALEGNTPRQASQSKRHRPMLEEMLKEFISRSDMERKSGTPSFDFRGIAEELGFGHLTK